MPVCNGPLILRWVEEQTPSHLFRPVVRSQDDRYHMGWEIVEPREKPALTITFGKIPWASAEGLVGLACISETIRLKNFGVDFARLAGDPTWYDAMGLDQFVSGTWLASRNAGIGGDCGDKLRQWRVESPESCLETARWLTGRAEGLLSRLSCPVEPSLLTGVQLLIHQALLNVFEHAYFLAGSPAIAFSAMTVSNSAERQASRDYLTGSELTWLKQCDKQILEIAIGDFGAGIPATLWKAYGQAHRGAFLDSANFSLGSNSGKEKRAGYHQRIAHWAMAHNSTRKSAGDFRDHASRLNWRGLHRAANSIANVDGCIVIRSGQARAGYAFHSNGATPLEVDERHREFPGTTLVIRVPIPAPVARFARSLSIEPHTANLQVQGVVRASAARSEIKNVWGDRPRIVAVCHPFISLDADGTAGILELVEAIPPNCIQLHAHLNPLPGIPSQFHAFEDEQGQELEPPRLMCFWSPERSQWKFAGRVPRAAQAFIADIELHGSAPIPQELKQFAEGLRHDYASHVSIRDGVFHLDIAHGHLPDDVADRILLTAFDEFVSADKARTWLTKEPGTVVLLRSGRIVRRYVSILELLNTNDVLTRAVGRKLRLRLDWLRQSHPNLRVVTDSEASYFLIRHLLGDQQSLLEIQPDDGSSRISRPTVGFFDAVYRGTTMNRFSARLEDPVALICAIDLRHQPETEGAITPFESLLKFPFDPQEIPEEQVDSGVVIKEVDQITLDPCDPVDPSTCSFGTSVLRTDFAWQNPQLVRYGLHANAGRIQVVSLSVSDLRQNHEERLCHWIVEEFEAAALRARSAARFSDIVLFTRSDSVMRDLAASLAPVLKSRFRANVFSATIPVAPYKTRKVFARVDNGQDLLNNLQKLDQQNQFVFDPPTNYAALLLEDAAVTGRGMLNFLIRLAVTKRQRPAIIVAIPVLSRLSPIEEQHFQSLLKTLGPPPDPLAPRESQAAQARFEFAPLFRLQVQSWDDFQATPANRFLARLRDNGFSFAPRLQDYLDAIAKRFERFSAMQERAEHSAVCAHPFYTGPVPSGQDTVSVRTVWIRHLISLYEQNVAVLGQLLHDLRESCVQADCSLLTLFGAEPPLLELRPFQRHCRQDLMELAISAINNPQIEPYLKSDALVVLLNGLHPSPAQLAEVAAGIENDPDLLNQFLVMFLANWGTCCHDPLAAKAAIYSQTRDKDGIIHASLDSLDRPHQVCVFSTQEEVADAVVRAVAHTIHHAVGDLRFGAPTTGWLHSSPDERSAQPGYQVAALLLPASRIARDRLAPALSGLVFLADRNQYGQAVRELRRADHDLRDVLRQLEALAHSLGDEPLGVERSASAEDLWGRLRSLTQSGSPQNYLAVAGYARADSGVLERWMPRFFCLPCEVAGPLARARGFAHPLANWQSEAMAVASVLLQAPLDDVHEFFHLLYEDAAHHGTGTAETEFTLVRGGREHRLEVSIRNAVSPTPSPGNGKSQERAQRIAARNRWTIVFPARAIPDESYRVRIVFPVVYEIPKE